MDVHHHSKTEYSPKRWKSFLIDGLLIFIAVTLSFFAENVRAYFGERHEEKAYILSMIQDLQADVTNIDGSIKSRNERHIRLDSLSLLLGMHDYEKHSKMIYYYARWTVRNDYFVSSDRTIQQLKNAGGLRLIKNQASSNAIMEYDAQVKTLNTNNFALEAVAVADYVRLTLYIFDGNILDEMYRDTTLIKPRDNPEFLTDDRQKFNALVTQLHFIKSLNSRNVYLENKLKIQAEHTIAILKKEYHLN